MKEIEKFIFTVRKYLKKAGSKLPRPIEKEAEKARKLALKVLEDEQKAKHRREK